MKYSICVLLTLMCVQTSLSSRILFLFPSPSKSHLIIAHGLSTILAERGHEVTVFSPFPLSKPLKNHREFKSPISEVQSQFASDLVKNPKQSIFNMLPKLMETTEELGQSMMDMPEFRKMMKEEKFDLLIIGMFMNNYLFGVADHFKCPSIMLSVTGTFTISNLLIGNPLAVDSVPHLLIHVAKMGFVDRVKNFALYGVDLVMTEYMRRKQKAVYDRNFPSDRYITYDQATGNLSMALVNSHFTEGRVRPNVPALVEIGGIQINPVTQKLPTELQTFIDGGKDGAILFSLGSNAKTSFLPREKIDILLKAFSKLKQRVIMKWESDTLERKPENVLIGKWLPQDSILAHPNIKLFITHGGLGSIVESKYHGVPIIGMPIFADQHGNIESAVKDGWGLKVDFINLKEDELSEAIHKMLTNDKYSATVKQIAKLYKDRPMNARETAVYWVEYVIRHHGAPHIRYSGTDLNFIQRTSLDIIVFLISLSYVFFKLFAFIVKFIFKKTCGKKSKNLQKDKKTS